MTPVLTIIAALAITGGSISPQEAKARTADASRKEAAKVCKQIERELSGHYTGGSYTTDFLVEHPYTAHYVGEHFSDHWRLRWNDWYANDYFPAGIIYGPNPFKPKPTTIKKGDEYVRVRRWQLELTPKNGQ